MSEHPDIMVIVEGLRNDEIGGAADTAKEVMHALSSFVQDSQAKDIESLVAEVDDAVLDIMRVMPSLAPPINALHKFVGSVERGDTEGATVKEMKEIIQKTADDFSEWAEITFMRFSEGYDIELELVEEFNAAHPDIKANVDSGPAEDTYPKLALTTEAKTPPNIYVTYFTLGAVTNDLAMDLTPFIEAEGEDWFNSLSGNG